MNILARRGVSSTMNETPLMFIINFSGMATVPVKDRITKKQIDLIWAQHTDKHLGMRIILMKSTFLTPLKVQPISKREWKILEEFSFYADTDTKRDWIISVPEGDTTDFASIPRCLHWLLPPWHHSYGKAAVIHDYLYKGGFITVQGTGERYYPSKLESDKIFLEGMIVLNAPVYRRRVMYRAVRIGGTGHWG